MPKKYHPANSNRETALLVKYNLTEDAYRALDEAQNFKCRICSKHKSETRCGVLDVDHCHKTGQVRGLLCGTCNKVLGLVKEDTTTLLKMIQYLKRNL